MQSQSQSIMSQNQLILLLTTQISQTWLCSTFVKISIFCLNNFARWVSRSWLLALWVFERLNLSSLNGLLREEVVLPVLSVRWCLRWSPWGKICFTSIAIASNWNNQIFKEVNCLWFLIYDIGMHLRIHKTFVNRHIHDRERNLDNNSWQQNQMCSKSKVHKKRTLHQKGREK